MITLHYLQNSRSQRLAWLLEELGQPYTLKRYERNPRTQLAPAALKALHPLGKAPVLTDGALVLAESGAIVEYLIDRYGAGRFKPEGQQAQALCDYRFWLHFAEGSMMPQLVFGLVLSTARAKTPRLVRPVVAAVEQGIQKQFIQPTLQAQLALVEQTLGRQPWLVAGPEPSGADVMMSFPLEALAARKLLDGYPRIQDWVRRVHARPAYQAALQKSGDYDYA